MASESTTRKTPTQDIFDRIKNELDNGTVPWHKPWVVNSCGIVSHKGTGYSLRNRMLLMYPGEYLTFQQALKEGGCVRKGEHGQTVYFSKRITVKNKDTDEDEDKYILRAWTVFRTEQCDNVTSKFEHLWKHGGEPKEDTEAMQIVNDYCGRCEVKRVNGGNQAFYHPDDHTVVVPGYQAYTERELYWNSMFHELGHSTARYLNRKQGGTFGSSQYAREELVAEICAALCLGKLGMDTTLVIQQSGAYLRSWQSKIRNLKPNEFGEACRLAEQAYNLILTSLTTQTRKVKMTEEEVKNLTQDKMFNELCKMKAVKEVRDCKTAIGITVENLRGTVDTDTNIYDNPAFVELVSQMVLMATKDKDSGIGGDHILLGALKFCIAHALKDMYKKGTRRV